MAARAVFDILVQGTGASNAGTLALTNSNLGNLTFSAPDEGYEVRIVVSGNLTPRCRRATAARTTNN